MFRLTFPNTLSDKLDLDYHQKMSVKFQVKDKQGDEYVRVQQVFLRFTNKKSNKEIIYLAEATGGVNSQYKADVVSKQRLRYSNFNIFPFMLGFD